MPNLKKIEIIEKIQIALNLSPIKARYLYESIMEEIIKTLKKEKKLKIPSFATFEVHHKKERPGRNFITQNILKITKRNVIIFKPSRYLKDIVSNIEKKDKALSNDNYN